MKRLLFLLASAITLIGCNTSDERLPLLYGEWRGESWTRAGQPVGADAKAVKFSFQEDYTYTATLGTQQEKGGFVFREGKLYTTAIGDTKVEKVVGVDYLSQDSLIFDMNRQGDPEKLLLLRK